MVGKKNIKHVATATVGIFRRADAGIFINRYAGECRCPHWSLLDSGIRRNDDTRSELWGINQQRLNRVGAKNDTPIRGVELFREFRVFPNCVSQDYAK